LSSKKQILFIINPISGTGKQKIVEQLIAAHLDQNKFNFTIKYTKRAGHAIGLSAAASSENYAIVVAVGGDGSVNEVGQSLVGSDTVLGIIPTGSGNGLARHLNIPMKLKTAIELLNEATFNLVDTGTMNGLVFLGTAGIGFDAHIGKLFDEAETRGFFTYVKLSVMEFFKYKPAEYKIEIDGVNYTRKAFLVCFGNSNQWGNNVYISPNSVINDGFLRVIILQKMSLLFLPFFILKLFRKRVATSTYYEELKGKRIIVKQVSKLAHLDGDPIEIGNELIIEVKPSSLNVVNAVKDIEI